MWLPRSDAAVPAWSIRRLQPPSIPRCEAALGSDGDWHSNLLKILDPLGFYLRAVSHLTEPDDLGERRYRSGHRSIRAAIDAM